MTYDRESKLFLCLSALVYWHEQGNGHIDESWWDEAKELVEECIEDAKNKDTHPTTGAGRGEA